MRSYLDIIEDLKDGKKPDYEEVRLACLMAEYMLHFADQDIIKLTGYAKSDQKTDLQSRFAIKSFETRHNKSRKMPPDQYLGSYHPDAPGRQEERQLHQKIFDKFMKEKGYDKDKEKEV